ncbi:MAG: hypothetical protein KDL87_09965 [Verrucomicrobiae bacterium]|nr:hypothetical protein [Verrucomicrobiae bacterium]
MKTIEFEPTNTNTTSDPWGSTTGSGYEDLILRPEYASRKLRIPAGETWLRIVPAVKGSRGWLLRLHSLSHPGGRHVHAKSITPGAWTVFDTAYRWLATNRPELLFSKKNRSGFRLLTDSLAACWVLTEEAGKVAARILICSGYDGSRGSGNAGLGYRLKQLVEERDEETGIVADPLDPAVGLQICIERLSAPGAKYPSYKLRRGQPPAPIQRYLEKMPQDEIEALCPIEQTIRLLDADHEWDLLAKVIGEALRDEIRADTEARKPSPQPAPIMPEERSLLGEGMTQ